MNDIRVVLLTQLWDEGNYDLWDSLDRHLGNDIWQDTVALRGVLSDNLCDSVEDNIKLGMAWRT